MERVSKYNYYLDIAQTVLERGTCLRRKFGAVIVRNDEIISTGYVGSPRGRKNCCDTSMQKPTPLFPLPAAIWSMQLSISSASM